MSQLRRLKDCTLQKSSRVKQSNGTYIDEYENIGSYKIIIEELTDQVSASIYGANINKTYRINSPYNSLENYLSTKLINNSEDNISKYFIMIRGNRYKIISVKLKWIDIELL